MSKTLFFGSSFVSMFKLLQSDDKYLKSKTTTLKNIKYNIKIKTKPKKNKKKIVLT